VKRIPTLRAVFGRVKLVQPEAIPDAKCRVCGGRCSPGLALHCPSCAAFPEDIGSHTIHACGGCGVVFLVNWTVTVEPIVFDGTARVFCACCQDFLGKRLPARNMALTPGYDEEGQRINARLRDPSPTARRKHRRHETQAHLENVLRTRSLRTGVAKAAPLFLAS